jgi:hypothetical protein
MRRPLIPLLLAAAAGWQPARRAPTHHVTEPVGSRHARPTRLNLQRDTTTTTTTTREGWFGFGEDDDGALLSKAENWFKPKNHYTVEKGDTSHYAVLGVARDATDLEIKRAYRRQSKTCHPDVDPSVEGRARFDAVTLAYETLKDSKKRDAYDGALQVERIAADAEAWIDSVAVPFLRDSAMPTLSDFTKNVEKATENVTLAQAAAAAAGFVVAGPVGAAAGVAAQKVYSDNIDEAPAVVKPAPTANATNATKTPPRRRGPASTAAAGAVGFVVAGPIGAAAGVAAERYSRRTSTTTTSSLYDAPGAAAPPVAAPAPAPAPAPVPAESGKLPRRRRVRAPSSDSDDHLIRMTRSELRRTLLRRGVQATGSKAELIERIRALPPEEEGNKS